MSPLYETQLLENGAGFSSIGLLFVSHHFQFDLRSLEMDEFLTFKNVSETCSFVFVLLVFPDRMDSLIVS